MDDASLTSVDEFASVTLPAEGRTLVSGSRFIAYLAPATDAAGALDALGEQQRRYHDATHHCWAYRVGRPGPLSERSTDAGEPTGAAGRPIADALRRANLENVICVVTRYFGGTKLGTAGLSRAYGDSAQAAIDAARPVTCRIVQSLELSFDFDRTGAVFRVLDEFGVTWATGVYDTRAHGMVQVRRSRVPAFLRRLGELSSGGVEAQARETGIL